MSDRVTLHLAIRGRVQGVGFRYSMSQEAEALGITGWVRNRRDGSVEAVVQGDAAAVEAIRGWAGRGPLGAGVTEVSVASTEGTYAAFELRPTA